MKKIIILFTILSIIILTACGGGGGGDGVSTNNSGSNDLFKIISNISRNVSSDTATQVGALSSDGIQLDLAKGALNNNSNVTIRQYSNDAAFARFSENFPSLASFTVVSSLYELTAKDNNSKTQTLLEVPSELSVALSEDLNTNKLYYAVVKQNGEWSLLPIETNSANNSSRFVFNTSKSIRIIINSLYQSLFIVAVTKKNITTSKLTYSEEFKISINGSETSPKIIKTTNTQIFDEDIEVKIKLTLKGDITPDKADISITALQNGNKKISIRKSDKTYKDFNFSSAEQTGKYKTSFKLTSDLATSNLSGDTAIYTFYIKAKDMNISDMPSKLVLKASVKASSLFYSNDMQIIFQNTAQPIVSDSFSIVYDGNGNSSGVEPVDSKAYKNGDKATISSIGNLSKNGYYFVHWNTKSDDSGISYSENDIINVYGNILLYAIWESDLSTAVVESVSPSIFEEEYDDGERKIIITGKNFGNTKKTLVLFNINDESEIHCEATPLTWTNTSISFKIPLNLTDTTTTIEIKILDTGLILGNSYTCSFKYVPYLWKNAVVSQITPSVIYGYNSEQNNITIEGNGFGTTPQDLLIFNYNGYSKTISKEQIYNWTPTRIVLPLPISDMANSITSNTTLYIKPANNTSYTDFNSILGSFEFKTSQITYISPTEGSIGKVLTVTGQGFGSTQSNMYIYIGESYASVIPSSWSENSFQIRVPNFTNTGSKNIKLKINGNDIVSNFNYEVRAPMIYSISKSDNLSEGDNVTIYGNFFSNKEDLQAIYQTGRIEITDTNNNSTNVISMTDANVTWTDNSINFLWPKINSNLLTTKTFNIKVIVGSLTSSNSINVTD